MVISERMWYPQRCVDFTKVVVVHSYPRFHRNAKSCRLFNFNGFSVLYYYYVRMPNTEANQPPSVWPLDERYWHEATRVVLQTEWQLCNLRRSRWVYTLITILITLCTYITTEQTSRSARKVDYGEVSKKS